MKALVVAGLVAAVFVLPRAQAGEPGSTFRVFLKDGQALASYGESAVVGDRLVFTLLVGQLGAPALQMMSLPMPSVDLDRTQRYAATLRAAHYATTRGEADYAAMTAEVQRALDQIAAVEDPKRRLELADEARRRLLDWSADHHHYRAPDIRELAGLFDQVIAELRAAAGESRFALELRSGPAAPVREPILPVPGLRDSIALARAAAAAADIGEERMAVLRVAAAVLEGEAGAEDLKASLKKDLDAELAADAAYRALAADLLARADAAVRRGDLESVRAIRAALADRDRALGGRRPQHVAALAGMLDARLEAVRVHRLALERYALVRRSFLEYERLARPVMSGFDGLLPVPELRPGREVHGVRAARPRRCAPAGTRGRSGRPQTAGRSDGRPCDARERRAPGDRGVHPPPPGRHDRERGDRSRGVGRRRRSPAARHARARPDGRPALSATNKDSVTSAFRRCNAAR